MRVCIKSIRYQLIILTEPESPLNISLSLSMAFAAEAQVGEEKFRLLTVNTVKFQGTKVS